MSGKFDIRFEEVQKSFGSFTAIPSLNLEIRSGERLVLLGPSGCGKTTVMRLIAGLEHPTSGAIYMGGQKVNDLDASERNIAMVFQNYALYPHMTVFENMAFSLRLQKLPKTEIVRRVHQAAGMLELQHLLERKPRELSGGQRQRVALGRAIVRQAPYFLLDEPLSNLDAQLRTSARNELVDLHEKLQTTMVYVTHDQVEAMTIGQRIAVLKNGILQQIGTPEEIYARPANGFVATFIGNPPMNLIPAARSGDGIVLADREYKLPEEFVAGLRRHPESSVLLGIRPEAVRIGENAAGNRQLADLPPGIAVNPGITVGGTYVRCEYLGNQYIHHIDLPNCRIQAATPHPLAIGQNAPVTLGFPAERIHFFAVGGERQRIEIPEAGTRIDSSVCAMAGLG